VSSTVVLDDDRETGDLTVFRGVLDVVRLVDRLCRRPRFGDLADSPDAHSRRAQRGLPLLCLVRSPQHSGLLGGLAKRLTRARPSRVPHCLVRLRTDRPALARNEFSDVDVHQVREILAHAAERLGSSRNARGGRIRFRRFGLLDWLMSEDLDDVDIPRRAAELRGRLRGRDIVQRFDDTITSAGKQVDLTGWWRFLAGLIRLLPPLLFAVRVTGRVPFVGEQYRWFLRQPHVTPEVPGGFLGFAERLTAGRDGWRQEDAAQVARLLTNAFLEDLRRAWRSPWRMGGPRRMAYVALLLDNVTADNGGYALLQLINDVRNEIGRFDPLLLISAGEQVPPDGRDTGRIYFASNAAAGYETWRNALRDARRARTDTAWYLRVSVPDLDGSDRADARERDDIRQQVDGLTATAYRIASPPWWGRRVVPVGTVVVLLAAAMVGYVTWSGEHCGHGWRWPVPGSTLRWLDGQCVGVTDGGYTFDPALAEVTALIQNQNEQTEQRHRDNPARSYVTVVDLQALTPPLGNSTGLAAERESLEGAAVFQAQTLRDPSYPLVRLLIGNAGSDMTYGTTVADQLRTLPTGDAPLVGVIGLDHSTRATDATVLALADDGLPTIAASLSEDQLANSNPLYYQVSPQNKREAAVAAAFADQLPPGTLAAKQIRVYHPDDPEDTYAQNLTDQVLDAFGKAGYATQEVRFAPSDMPASQVKPGVLYPTQNGKNACGFPGLVYYAGDGVPDFNAFLDGLKQCTSSPAVLADDDVTRYVADTRTRELNQTVPFWYTAFAAPNATTSQATEFYNGNAGLYALFPHERDNGEDPSLDGHAALTYDTMQTLRTAVAHLRLGNAAIPITPGHVWRELSSISSTPPTKAKPDPNNNAVQGVTGLIDFGRTGGNLHYPANKQISILHVVAGKVEDKPAFYCGDPADRGQGQHCPLDQS
jgi:hypothetical protein